MNDHASYFDLPSHSYSGKVCRKESRTLSQIAAHSVKASSGTCRVVCWLRGILPRLHRLGLEGGRLLPLSRNDIQARAPFTATEKNLSALAVENRCRFIQQDGGDRFDQFQDLLKSTEHVLVILSCVPLDHCDRLSFAQCCGLFKVWVETNATNDSLICFFQSF